MTTENFNKLISELQINLNAENPVGNYTDELWDDFEPNGYSIASIEAKEFCVENQIEIFKEGTRWMIVSNDEDEELLDEMFENGWFDEIC